jgi:hypothetical protein
MASTQTWTEGNGTNCGTSTPNRTEANWKNIDDSTTAYSAAGGIITAGNNSFDKVQAILYAGTFNSLSSLTYKVSTTAPGTGLTVVGSVISASPRTPATTATGDTTTNLTTGLSANFIHNNTWTSVFAVGTATGGPNDATSWYGQAFRTQLQTTGSAAPGDIATVTITATWTES